MNPREIDEMAALEDRHWWFVGKRRLVSALLPPGSGRALDFGCGTGGILSMLAAERTAVGADRSLHALAHCRRRGQRALVCAGESAVPFRAASFGLITALDVIEHVDDDVALVRDLGRALVPGGILLIAVPAYQALWSRHDEVLGHRRRYTAASLRRTIAAAGLQVRRLTYTNMFILPPAAVWRLLGRLRARSAPQTDFAASSLPVGGVLSLLYRIEAAMVRRARLPFGLSVVALAQASGSAGPARG